LFYYIKTAIFIGIIPYTNKFWVIYLAIFGYNCKYFSTKGLVLQKLTSLAFILPTLLLSQDYCIYIDELELTPKNNTKIYSILDDVAYPSTKIKNNKIIIYSGKFRSFEDAQRLVPLTKSRYKKAKVQQCNNTTIYREKRNFIQDKKPKRVKQIKKEFEYTPKRSKPDKTDNFDITMLDEMGYISKDILSRRYSRHNTQDKTKQEIDDAIKSQDDGILNGLYLKTNTAYDLKNDDTAYDVRLEFDIFDQGYYQNKRKNEKFRVANKINFYKTVKNIEILKKEQELLKIKKYENTINVSSLLLQLRIKEKDLNNAKAKYKAGIITRYDYEGYKLAIQQIKDELFMFKNITLLKIPQDLWTLLNEIEYTKLINEDELSYMLDKDNIDLKLAQTLQERKILAEKWSDKLKVNVYAGMRKMYLAQEQTLVGVEAKIPLSVPSRNSEFNKVQDQILANQAKLQHSKSKENLIDTIATYRYKQQKIKTYSYELSRLKQRIKDLKTISNSSVNITFGNEQKLKELYLQKHTQIQLERLATYKELVNIMYLIHSNSLKDVLHYGVYH